ncbi:DUF5397 family protein [Acidisoma silvae]|uniref:DUF5397 family protein n=1 Tax=Acidisoma silvae TaxID=2802396 RepID=A0A964DX11_9PROT|nr:DUF5397 family protein [Acidisoma silvae]MCB8873599.1 DUF5397 family protein [Acidisoma silvae]
MLQTEQLIGTWRRFGSAGPVYEILRSVRQLPDGDRLMRIQVVETGEELDYKLHDILKDPREN